jgi:hypothetical protein
LFKSILLAPNPALSIILVETFYSCYAIWWFMPLVE